MKLKTAILGVTGYVGQQLVSLLVKHPNVDLRVLTSEKFSGMKVDQAFPHLYGYADSVLVPVSKIPETEPIDLVFSCLPSGVSSVYVKKFLEKGARVIDLSPDLRFKEPDDYFCAYGTAPRYPSLLRKSVYGLGELNRENITGSFLVANPGCYTTCVLLGVVPFLRIYKTTEDIIVDIKSSFSTSGRAPRLISHYAEVKEDVSVENIGEHDQKHEIKQMLSEFSSVSKNITFINTQVPVKRGIMAISYLKPVSRVSLDEVSNIYTEFYEKEPFISVCENDIPRVASVSGSNLVLIGFLSQQDYLVVVSVLDNLMKGSAGQAVQNMNIIFGFPKNQGLEQIPLFP